MVDFGIVATAGSTKEAVVISANSNTGDHQERLQLRFFPNLGPTVGLLENDGAVNLAGGEKQRIASLLSGIKVFSFEASSLGRPIPAQQIKELQLDGNNLVGALTHLRDKDEEAYDDLRKEFQRWIPEYDSIVFENDPSGIRHLKLRQRI